jgi:hypothetical protein
MFNLNFDSERTGKYPETIEQILEATNEELLEWISTLPAPSNGKELVKFNEIFNQFHLRGGKA